MTHPLRAGLLALVGIAALSLPAAAQQANFRQPIMTVSGEASVTVTPDMVHLRAGVTTQGKTARDAAEANAKAMTAVIAALTGAGIAERDIQTARLSVAPVYEQQPRSAPGKITGFHVSNQVMVKLRDPAKAGETVDLLVGAGANEIGGIDFVVSEPSKMIDKARADAVADARRKAELYAKAAGVGLGRMLIMTEDGGQSPVPMRMERLAAASPSTPVMPGERILQAAVTITYQIIP